MLFVSQKRHKTLLDKEARLSGLYFTFQPNFTSSRVASLVLPRCSLLIYFHQNTCVTPRPIMDYLSVSLTRLGTPHSQEWSSSSHTGMALFLPGPKKELCKCWTNKYMVNCLQELRKGKLIQYLLCARNFTSKISILTTNTQRSVILILDSETLALNSLTK